MDSRISGGSLHDFAGESFYRLLYTFARRDRRFGYNLPFGIEGFSLRAKTNPAFVLFIAVGKPPAEFKGFPDKDYKKTAGKLVQSAGMPHLSGAKGALYVPQRVKRGNP
jgi:hypothetical protein